MLTFNGLGKLDLASGNTNSLDFIGFATWTIDNIAVAAKSTIAKLEGATYTQRADANYDVVYGDSSTDIVSEGLKTANDLDL